MAARSSILERAKELGLEVSEDPIEPGDTYLAERNTGPKILVCERVSPRGWIQATAFPSAYSYDIPECVKIVGEIPEAAKKYIID